MFLLVDLREYFVRYRVGDEKKALKMTSHFQSFFFSFLISPEQTVKRVK